MNNQLLVGKGLQALHQLRYPYKKKKGFMNELGFSEKRYTEFTRWYDDKVPMPTKHYEFVLKEHGIDLMQPIEDQIKEAAKKTKGKELILTLEYQKNRQKPKSIEEFAMSSFKDRVAYAALTLLKMHAHTTELGMELLNTKNRQRGGSVVTLMRKRVFNESGVVDVMQSTSFTVAVKGKPTNVVLNPLYLSWYPDCGYSFESIGGVWITPRSKNRIIKALLDSSHFQSIMKADKFVSDDLTVNVSKVEDRMGVLETSVQLFMDKVDEILEKMK